jgi:hypothetical protein
MDKNKCTLTDSQLIEKAQEWIHSLIDTGGRSWCLRIPADLNHDPDLIFSQLCMRLKNQDTIRSDEKLGYQVGDIEMKDINEYVDKIGKIFDDDMHGFRSEVYSIVSEIRKEVIEHKENKNDKKI